MRGWVLAIGLALSGISEARAATAYGAVIMEGAMEVGSDRWQMAKDWDLVVQFYRQAYAPKSGYTWTKLAESPKVKAIHIRNLKPGAKWEGLNIYETKKGVFVYVIKAPDSDKK